METIARIESGELDIPLFSIRYEELHEDTEGVRNGMYAFLGVDPDEALPLSRESGTIAGFGKNTGHGPAQVGTWRDVLTDEAKGWMKEEAGELLVELGYEKDLDW